MNADPDTQFPLLEYIRELSEGSTVSLPEILKYQDGLPYSTYWYHTFNADGHMRACFNCYGDTSRRINFTPGRCSTSRPARPFSAGAGAVNRISMWWTTIRKRSTMETNP